MQETSTVASPFMGLDTRVAVVTAIPPMPLDRPRAAGRAFLRFEDVTQDGRLVLEALPTPLGPTVWRGLIEKDEGALACLKNGILPIISRLVLEGAAGPFSANGRVDAEGTYQLARSGDGRFMIDVWADLFAPIGRTHGPRSAEGERTLAGRVLAEHVFTRPFAPPGQRRVTSLDFEGAPEVPGGRPSSPSFESIASVPEGAAKLDPSPRPDSMPIVFGLFHTDGNMHVNSLAYLRIFEEAGLRRFVELGRGSKFLGRSIDIAYRKPCFAGQVMRVVHQAFETDGKLGIAAVLVEDEATKDPEALVRARPYVFARMTFER
jgi:acyl-CoA thioesterase FadM